MLLTKNFHAILLIHSDPQKIVQRKVYITITESVSGVKVGLFADIQNLLIYIPNAFAIRFLLLERQQLKRIFPPVKLFLI